MARRMVLLALLLTPFVAVGADGLGRVVTWGGDKVQQGPIHSLAFMKGTRSVVYGSRDAFRHASFAHDFASTRLVALDRGAVTAIALAPDTKRVLVSRQGEETLKLVDIESGLEVGELPGVSPAAALAWSPSGERVLSVANNGDGSVIDVQQRKVTGSFFATASVLAAGFVDDGATIFVANDQGSIEFFDTETRRDAGKLSIGKPVVAVALSADGKRVAVANGKRIDILRRKSGTREWHVDLKEPLTALALSADGKLVCGGSRSLHLFVVGESEEEVARHRGSVRGLAVSPSGRRALSTGTDGTVRLWDTATGEHVRWLHCGPTTGPVAYASDGATALVGTVEGVLVVDPERDAIVRRLTGAKCWSAVSGGAEVTALSKASVACWPGDGVAGVKTFEVEAPLRALGGRRVLTVRSLGNDQWHLVERDLDAASERAAKESLSGCLKAVAFTPDSKLALVAAFDLEVWDVEKLERVKVFENCPPVLGPVGVSADGQFGMAVHEDERLRLWSLVGGWVVDTLGTGSLGWPTVITFSPRRDWVLIGSSDGRIHKVALPDPEGR